MKTFFKISHIIPLLIIACYTTAYTQVYSGKNGNSTLTGEAPLETIIAKSQKLQGMIELKSRKFSFKQDLESFSFSQGALQTQHAQENFWETDKSGYRYATFKGIIINDVDLSVNGTYQVTVKGNFYCHGVTKEMKISAKVYVKDRTIKVTSTYKVYLTDHKIAIPRLLSQKVSEEFETKIQLTLTPKQ